MTIKIREVLWKASTGWNYPYTGISPELLDRVDELINEQIESIKNGYKQQIAQQTQAIRDMYDQHQQQLLERLP